MEINTTNSFSDDSSEKLKVSVLKTPEHSAFKNMQRTVKKQSDQVTKDGILAEFTQSKSQEAMKLREDALKEKVLLAKQKIRKAALYGVGFRANLPNIVKGTHENTNYIDELLADTTESNNYENNLIKVFGTKVLSSVPPGAHEELFRYVQDNGNDPERFFFNSTSFYKGYIPIDQPKWYFGRNNKINPPENNPAIAINRYGYRGSKNIERFLTEPIKPPALTVTDHTPEFLRKNREIIDEYAPMIQAAPVGSINSLEAPRLWPKTTEYVNGYKKKELSTSSIYNRQTTAGLPIDKRPQTSPDLETLTNQPLRPIQSAPSKADKNLLTLSSVAFPSSKLSLSSQLPDVKQMSVTISTSPSRRTSLSAKLNELKRELTNISSPHLTMNNGDDSPIVRTPTFNQDMANAFDMFSPHAENQISSSHDETMQSNSNLLGETSAATLQNHDTPIEGLSNFKTKWNKALESTGAKVLSSESRQRQLKHLHQQQQLLEHHLKMQKQKYKGNLSVLNRYDSETSDTHETRGLVDPRDTLRSTGSMAIINRGLFKQGQNKNIDSKPNLSTSLSYDMKWQQIELHVNSLRVHLDRNESLIYVINKISQKLKEEAGIIANQINADMNDFKALNQSDKFDVSNYDQIDLNDSRRLINSQSMPNFKFTNSMRRKSSKFNESRNNISVISKTTSSPKRLLVNNNYWTLSRYDFIKILAKISYLEGFQEKQFSLIYSIFDVTRSNQFEYIDYLSSLLVLADPHINVYDRLRMIYEYHLEFGCPTRSAVDIAYKSCISAVYDQSTLDHIETLFKKEFRSLCYHNAVLTSPNTKRPTTVSFQEAEKTSSSIPRENISLAQSRRNSAVFGEDDNGLSLNPSKSMASGTSFATLMAASNALRLNHSPHDIVGDINGLGSNILGNTKRGRSNSIYNNTSISFDNGVLEGPNTHAMNQTIAPDNPVMGKGDSVGYVHQSNHMRVTKNSSMYSSQRSSIASSVRRPPSPAQNIIQSPSNIARDFSNVHKDGKTNADDKQSINIIDDYLNSLTFIDLLQKCPQLKVAIEESFRNRLQHYYGSSYDKVSLHTTFSPRVVSENSNSINPKYNFGPAVAKMKLFRKSRFRTEFICNSDHDEDVNIIESHYVLTDTRADEPIQ